MEHTNYSLVELLIYSQPNPSISTSTSRITFKDSKIKFVGDNIIIIKEEGLSQTCTVYDLNRVKTFKLTNK